MLALYCPTQSHVTCVVFACAGDEEEENRGVSGAAQSELTGLYAYVVRNPLLVVKNKRDDQMLKRRSIPADIQTSGAVMHLPVRAGPNWPCNIVDPSYWTCATSLPSSPLPLFPLPLSPSSASSLSIFLSVSSLSPLLFPLASLYLSSPCAGGKSSYSPEAGAADTERKLRGAARSCSDCQVGSRVCGL